MTQKSYNLIFAITAAVIAFSVYLLTLAPTVWFIDSGELSAVASTLGIAHPTGYPLFTIVGHIFTLLPFSNSEVYKLNVMSAFFCALGIFVFFLLVKFLISNYSVAAPREKAKKGSTPKNQPPKNPTGKNSPKEKNIKIPDVIKYATAGFSALLLAFSKTYWNAANSVEVYPLHVFFIIALILVFLKAIFNTGSSTGETFISKNRYYLAFAFLLGLSFTNHLTTILLAPACLTLFFYTNLYDKARMWKLLGFMAICFLVGFSVYLYLPIRANMNPAFLWGNPYNFERFYWHITGKQFSVWIFSEQGSLPPFLFLLALTIGLSFYGLLKQKTLKWYFHFLFFVIIFIAGYYVIMKTNKIAFEQGHLKITDSNKIAVGQLWKFSASLWGEFGTGLVLLSIPGIFYLSKFNLKIYYFTILAFFGCLFYSINYDINDIYSYFLLSYVIIAIWVGFGAVFIYHLMNEILKSTVQKAAFSITVVLLSLIALNTNYDVNDESKNYYVEEFTMNIFKNTAPNSIIISSQWDFWVSASWYYNFVKNIRADIVVIDKELLRRSWYYTFLERNYPEIYKNSKPEIEKFSAELYKFEHDLPYDQAIVKAFSDLMTSFVTNNPGRRIYTTWEIEQSKNELFAEDYSRIPDGLLFRLVPKDSLKNNKVSDYKMYDFNFTLTAAKDYYHETLMLSYAMMLTASAAYLISVNRPEDAKKYIELALSAKPNYPQAVELKRKYNL